MRYGICDVDNHIAVGDHVYIVDQKSERFYIKRELARSTHLSAPESLISCSAKHFSAKTLKRSRDNADHKKAKLLERTA